MKQLIYGLICLAALIGFNVAYAAEVSLIWDANTEAELGGYEILYGTQTGSYNVVEDVGNVTLHTVAGLAEGTTYYFVARAYDTTKTVFSDYSNEVNASIPFPPAAPTADMSLSPIVGRAPLTVTFMDLSQGDIQDRLWDFGNGTSSTEASGTVTYTSAGAYGVTLTVTGPGGSSIASQTVSVKRCRKHCLLYHFSKGKRHVH